MKTISKFLISLAAIFLLFGCGDNHSNPEELGKEFVSALYAGEGDKAIKMIDFEVLLEEKGKKDDDSKVEFVKGKIRSMAASVKKKVEKEGGIKEIKLDKADYNEKKDRVFCNYEITFNKSDFKKYEHVKLFNKNNKWYIDL